MARAVVAIIALGILAMVAVQGFSASLEDAGKDFNITGESWTPDPGNLTTLSKSNIDGAYYSPTVDVRDSNGELMEPSVDYIWFDENGTIFTVEGGDLDGENNAEIDYSYQVPTEEQRSLAGLLGMVPQSIGLLLPALLLMLVLVILRGG